MYDSQTKTELEDLAEFVRQETDGGREIMRFFLDVMRNRYKDAKMSHRFTAAHELARFGCEEAKELLKAVPRSGNGRTSSRAPAEPRPKDELADFIKFETDDGKEVIRFYLNVMRNRVEDARMGHKISAAKELLRRAFDDVLKISSDEDDLHRGAKECRKDSCEHTIYARNRWLSDGTNTKALQQIYGSKEAVTFVRRAVVDHRKKIVFDPTHVPDHDFTPIDNPEDDPYGKGSYGYEVLCRQFGDNQAIRVANKAAEEFNRKLAEDLKKMTQTKIRLRPTPKTPLPRQIPIPPNTPNIRPRLHRNPCAVQAAEEITVSWPRLAPGPVAANSDRGPPSPAAV